jgi:hypothetical protein
MNEARDTLIGEMKGFAVSSADERGGRCHVVESNEFQQTGASLDEERLLTS